MHLAIEIEIAEKVRVPESSRTNGRRLSTRLTPIPTPTSIYIDRRMKYNRDESSSIQCERTQGDPSQKTAAELNTHTYK